LNDEAAFFYIELVFQDSFGGAVHSDKMEISTGRTSTTVGVLLSTMPPSCTALDGMGSPVTSYLDQADTGFPVIALRQNGGIRN